MVPGETGTGGESDDNTPSPLWPMDKGNLLNKNNNFTGRSLDIYEKNLHKLSSSVRSWIMQKCTKRYLMRIYS